MAMEMGVGDGDGVSVLPSTTAYEAPAETTWFEIVATLPGGMVLPARMTPPLLGARRRGWLAMEMGIGVGDGDGVSVVPSMSANEEPAEMMWFETVATFPGGMVDAAAMMSPFGNFWIDRSAIRGGVGEEEGGRA